MADNTFSKKDIIQFIDEAIKQHGSLSPTMVKDIEAVVKTQVELGDADEYIQALAEDNDNIRKLLEDVLLGRDSNPTINVINVKNESVDSDDSGDDWEPYDISDDMDEMTGSFRDAMEDSMAENRNFMGIALGKMKGVFGDLYSSLYSSVGKQIDTILGEDADNVIDPISNLIRNIGGIFGRFQSYDAIQLGISRDSRDILEAMLDKENKQLDLMKGSQKAMEIAGNRTVDKLDGIGNSLKDVYEGQLDALKFAKEEKLRDIREKQKEREKKGLIATLIANILGGFLKGMLVGGIIAYILLPFKVIYDAVMFVAGSFFKTAAIFDDAAMALGGVVTPVTSAAKELGFFGRLLKSVRGLLSNFFGRFKLIKSGMEFFQKVMKIFTEGVPQFLKYLAGLIRFTGDTVAQTTKIAETLKRIPLIGGMVAKIADGIASVIGFIAKFIGGSSKLTGMFKFIGTIITRITGFANSINMMLIPGVATFKGFAFGLAKLAWPLTVLIGAIDFIRGFIGSSEATFLGKFKDGIVQMFVGFFEMPIRLLGWLYDKALQFIGMESEGTGDKLVSGFRNFVESIFGPIFKVIGVLAKLIAIPAKAFISTFINGVKFLFAIISGIFKVIAAPFVYIVKTIIGLWEASTRVIGNMIGIIISIVSGIFTTIYNVVAFFGNLLKLDFAAAFANISTIGEIWYNVWETIKGFFWDIVDAVKEFLSGQISAYVDMFGSIIGGIFRVLLSPLKFIWDQAQSTFKILKDLMTGTMFEPIIKFFEWIGGFMDKIISWVYEKLKSIPLVGKLFESEEEAKAAEQAKLKEQAEKVIAERTIMKDKIMALESKGDDIGMAEKWQLNRLKARDKKLSDEQGEIDKDMGLEVKKVETAKSVFVQGVGDHIGAITSAVKHTTSPYSGSEQPDTMGFRPPPPVYDTAAVGYVSPSGQKQFQHETPKQQMMVGSYEQEAERVKIEGAYTRPLQAQKDIQKEIKEMSKSQKETGNRPIIVNTGDKEKRLIEPPEDIEAMSILFLNKSWGLG